jgi:hypothetical protein
MHTVENVARFRSDSRRSSATANGVSRGRRRADPDAVAGCVSVEFPRMSGPTLAGKQRESPRETAAPAQPAQRRRARAIEGPGAHTASPEAKRLRRSRRSLAVARGPDGRRSAPGRRGPEPATS